MDLVLFQNFKNIFVVLVAALIFAGAVFWGIVVGKKQAESDLVLSQVSEVVLALNFFYTDNNRFPTADEFARSEIILNYLTATPQVSDINISGCTQNFLYSRPQLNAYEFSFCLPKADSGYKVGWNKINEQK